MFDKATWGEQIFGVVHNGASPHVASYCTELIASFLLLELRSS